MKKIHILFGTSGSWDDYTEFPIGAYSTSEMANLAGEKYLEKYEELDRLSWEKCPLPKEKALKILNYQLDEYEALSEELHDLISNWFYSPERRNIRNLNKEFHVKELDIDNMNIEYIFNQSN